MIVTSYTPNIKIVAYPGAGGTGELVEIDEQMSALTADRQMMAPENTGGGGELIIINPQNPTPNNHHLDESIAIVNKPHLLDQSTLISYIYCFIKNFIGASGTNTVAIDNKIEQAMDLVKSHLMFAVREEVEVLKEKIAELMERISQLEYENSILRANATPETLAQLQQRPNTNQNSSTQP